VLINTSLTSTSLMVAKFVPQFSGGLLERCLDPGGSIRVGDGDNLAVFSQRPSDVDKGMLFKVSEISSDGPF